MEKEHQETQVKKKKQKIKNTNKQKIQNSPAFPLSDCMDLEIFFEFFYEIGITYRKLSRIKV